MSRAEEELERIMHRDAPARKRVRTFKAVSMSSSSSSASNDESDEIGSNSVDMDTPGPGPAPLSPKPLLATMSSGNQIVVPRPNLPIALQDVIEFLFHFKIFVHASYLSPFQGVPLTKNPQKGLVPGDFRRSEDAMLAVLTKWNSVYTIAIDPYVESTEAMGEKVGSNLAIRCIVTKQERLLRPLYDYFDNLDRQAEDNLRDMTAKDMDEYAEHGPISWYHMQLTQRRFAGAAKAHIIDVSRKEQAKREKDKQASKILAEIEAAKVIENRGGIVFGSGGGARGGFEFNLEVQLSDEFTFHPPQVGPDGQIDFWNGNG
jgi:hypothetical protein